MRLAVFGRLLLGAVLTAGALAQDTNTNGEQTQQQSSTVPRQAASPTPTATATTNQTATLANGAYVTTITSIVANTNGQTGSQTFYLTMTIPGSANNNGNSSVTNNATLPTNSSGMVNGTMINGTDTNVTTPWNDTLGYLPFTPRLDAAYGIGGGLLILTGVPVATLGGKNRWSALAIISGYSVGLFCLIMIMSFGVTPALQPPSPHAPTAALRGLYLLAVGVCFLIGSGLGIFFYTFSKYWVGAAGGFSLGWFIVSLRKGGLVTGVGPRWAIIGGLTVASLLAALTPRLHEYVLLISSAWVGATAFTLGIDCFTRVGLKEFYVYNLGYSTAFPELNGGKFPLTQNMQVELGVVAAAAVIAAAVQFKVVNMLQKRRTQLAAEEEARIEAQEIDRAAEHFKNVDAELAEWEGKHGTDSSSHTLGGTLAKSNITARHLSTPTTLWSTPSTTKLKDLAESPPRDVTPMNDTPKPLSLLDEMGYRDDHAKGPDTPGTPITPSDPLDPELEQKLQLLSEVRRARQSIRSSMDYLRSSTGTPTIDRAAGSTPSETRPGSPSRSRHDSVGSILDRGRYDSGSSSLLLLNNTGRERKSSAGSSRMLDDTRNRHDSLGDRMLSPAEPSTVAGVIGNRLSLADVGRIAQANTDARPKSDVRPLSEWEVYVQSRNIVAPASPVQPAQQSPPVQHYAVVSDSVSRALTQRNSSEQRSPSMSVTPLPTSSPTPGQEYGANLARAIASNEQAITAALPPTAIAARRHSANALASRRSSAKAMTTEELAERHREVLSKMQDRVTGPIKEEQALVSAKDEWEKRQRAEREEQRRKEKRSERGDTGRGPAPIVATDAGAAPRSSDRSRRTDEWRKSLAAFPAARPMSPTRRQSGGNVVASAAAAAGSTTTAAAATANAPSAKPPSTKPQTRRSSRQNFIA